MLSLIITVIAILLVAAVALAAFYYGGSAMAEGRQSAEASTLINQGQQLMGAAELYKLHEGSWPNAQQDLVDGGYLKAIPVPPGANVTASAGLLSTAYAATAAAWEMPAAGHPTFRVSSSVTASVCQEVNLKSRGDNGILTTARTSLATQCYGPASAFTVVVSKETEGLATVLPVGTVSTGAVPTDPSSPEWSVAPGAKAASPAGPAASDPAPTDPTDTGKHFLVINSSSGGATAYMDTTCPDGATTLSAGQPATLMDYYDWAPVESSGGPSPVNIAGRTGGAYVSGVYCMAASASDSVSVSQPFKTLSVNISDRVSPVGSSFSRGGWLFAPDFYGYNEDQGYYLSDIVHANGGSGSTVFTVSGTTYTLSAYVLSYRVADGYSWNPGLGAYQLMGANGSADVSIQLNVGTPNRVLLAAGYVNLDHTPVAPPPPEPEMTVPTTFSLANGIHGTLSNFSTDSGGIYEAKLYCANGNSYGTSLQVSNTSTDFTAKFSDYSIANGDPDGCPAGTEATLYVTINRWSDPGSGSWTRSASVTIAP